MTTNKPGSDQQQPLYGCVSCFEYQTFPADHLRVYDGNCYCEDCWDAYPADADIEWTSLDSFTPALQAECEQLGKELAETELRALKFIHQCNAHVELYQELRGERDQLRAECEKLRKLVSVCADYLSHNEHTCISHGSVLHSMLIDAAMQETNL